jgi:hypothetical protein
MNKLEIKKCVLEIIDSLCDRNGFDDWWYNLDDDIEKEITSELESIIERRMLDFKDEILDIINSENSGLSHEQRLSEIEKVLKDKDYFSKKEKRVFKIEVGEIPKDNVQEYIEELKKSFMKQPNTISKDNDFKLPPKDITYYNQNKDE